MKKQKTPSKNKGVCKKCLKCPSIKHSEKSNYCFNCGQKLVKS